MGVSCSCQVQEDPPDRLPLGKYYEVEDEIEKDTDEITDNDTNKIFLDWIVFSFSDRFT